MRVIESLKEMTETARGWLAGGTVGFVPIKGDLHEGHMVLIEEAYKACEVAVVGLLGPCLPFSTHEERARQMRNLEMNLQLLRRYRNLVVFVPRFEEIYAAGSTTYVMLTGLPMMQLDEAERAYVYSLMTLTVKLLYLVRPDVLYIGQKNVRQTAILYQVIRDLNIDVRLHIMPTVRESDGLALGNRNRQLSGDERQAAALLYQALQAGKARIARGERRSSVIEQVMVNQLQHNPLISLKFVGVCSANTFLPVSEVAPGIVLSLVIFIGIVCLMDTITWQENGQWRM